MKQGPLDIDLDATSNKDLMMDSQQGSIEWHLHKTYIEFIIIFWVYLTLSFCFNASFKYKGLKRTKENFGTELIIIIQVHCMLHSGLILKKIMVNIINRGGYKTVYPPLRHPPTSSNQALDGGGEGGGLL